MIHLSACHLPAAVVPVLRRMARIESRDNPLAIRAGGRSIPEPSLYAAWRTVRAEPFAYVGLLQIGKNWLVRWQVPAFNSLLPCTNAALALRLLRHYGFAHHPRYAVYRYSGGHWSYVQAVLRGRTR